MSRGYILYKKQSFQRFAKLRASRMSVNTFAKIIFICKRSREKCQGGTFHNYLEGESPVDILERSIVPRSYEEEDWEGEMQLQLQTQRHIKDIPQRERTWRYYWTNHFVRWSRVALLRGRARRARRTGCNGVVVTVSREWVERVLERGATGQQTVPSTNFSC